MERLSFGSGAPHDPRELAIHVARYGVAARLCRGRRVLDVACGEGYGSHLMATRWGAASVHAIDVSSEAIAGARTRFDDPRITWLEQDVDRLDAAQLDVAFDVIVSFETIEHLAEPERFLRTLKALLAPGGAIFVSCPNDHWYYGAGRSKNPWHRHTWTFEEFKALAESVLGTASGFLLGTTQGGFCNVLERAAPRTLDEGVRGVEPVRSLLVPPASDSGPSPDESLYWIGLWGVADADASSTVIPLSPDHRFAVDSLRPRFPYRQRRRPRLALVVDVRGWAFDNIAQQIRTHLGDVYDVVVLYATDYPDAHACLQDLLFVYEPDVVHYFWREYLYEILMGDPLGELPRRFDVPDWAVLDRFTRTAITMSVYDHLYTDEDSLRRRQPYLWFIDGYSVSSEKLRTVYSQGVGPAPDVVIEDGVDLDVFHPADERRGPAGALVVGWAGNSEWNRTPDRDPKGLHTIVRPALAQLEAEGVPVVGRFVDSSERRVPREEMPKFYRSLDVYLCASEIEGTPNPVLEAMACGIPIVSTDVGIVPQVLGPEQRRFIVRERTIDAFVEALRVLAGDRALRQRLGAENLAQIRTWSWFHQMGKWMQLFRIAGDQLTTRGAMRRGQLLQFAARAVSARDEELRRTRQALAATEEMVLARWDIIQEQGATIGERDARIAALKQRIARLEGDLHVARSLRGSLRQVARQIRRRVARFGGTA